MRSASPPPSPRSRKAAAEQLASSTVGAALLTAAALVGLWTAVDAGLKHLRAARRRAKLNAGGSVTSLVSPAVAGESTLRNLMLRRSLSSKADEGQPPRGLPEGEYLRPPRSSQGNNNSGTASPVASPRSRPPAEFVAPPLPSVPSLAELHAAAGGDGGDEGKVGGKVGEAARKVGEQTGADERPAAAHGGVDVAAVTASAVMLAQ